MFDESTKFAASAGILISITIAAVGLVAATAVTLFTVFVGVEAHDAKSCERVERELLAYRHCLQSAGQMQCQMTPTDFVRYYEVKAQTESCHGTANNPQ